MKEWSLFQQGGKENAKMELLGIHLTVTGDIVFLYTKHEFLNCFVK